MTGLAGALVPSPLSLAVRLAPYAALAVTSAVAWHFDGRAIAYADLVRTQAASFKQAQAAATQIANQALAHENAFYHAKAQEADYAYQTQLADAQSAADRYVAANRVHPARVAGDARDTTRAARRDSADIPQALPANPVMVSSSDVQACTDATAYALRAHEWAASIEP